jgi:hypothetical protein
MRLHVYVREKKNQLASGYDFNTNLELIANCLEII